ncbi:hypothetical protein RA27_18260 [Ruegeria sp. ANG-R]|uniref:hypothetical protein n=1 Tax=Ruegeria sp. ANG-R TaxID=1577903 RepID=UPI00057C4492|nr:hypothetical protein [Ruegeria sp. ANG-R]KIC38837.1 hypothetical protein RA27_18260 [Ruegeria sp. ANG-R]
MGFGSLPYRPALLRGCADGRAEGRQRDKDAAGTGFPGAKVLQRAAGEMIGQHETAGVCAGKRRRACKAFGVKGRAARAVRFTLDAKERQ